MLGFIFEHYKNQRMWINPLILVLMFVCSCKLDCYKTKKIYNKAVDTYPYAIQFFAECYKSKKMCDKAVDTCTFVFDCVCI